MANATPPVNNITNIAFKSPNSLNLFNKKPLNNISSNNAVFNLAYAISGKNPLLNF